MITILSDIDGVLIDSENSVFQAYKKAFELQALILTRQDFLWYLWNKPWNSEVIERVYTGVDVKKLRKDKQRIYKTLSLEYNWALIGLLQYFSSTGNELILVTSGSEEATEYKLTGFTFVPDKVVSAAKKDVLFWQQIKRTCKNQDVWLFDDCKEVCDKAGKAGIKTLHYGFRTKSSER